MKDSKYLHNKISKIIHEIPKSGIRDFFDIVNSKKDVISLGIDIETGGHVFQLIFSNTQSIDDISSILDAEGEWSKREIFFGFNILRIF